MRTSEPRKTAALRPAARRRRLATAAALCVWLAGLNPVAGQVFAHPQDDTQEPPSVGRTPTGLIQLHVREADLAAVLRLLSQQEQVNIITGPGVSGTVTADFYNVTLDEALGSILRSQGLSYERNGKFIYVMSADEWSKRSADRRVIDSRVYELHYISAAEAAALISPVLSGDGRIALTAPALTGIPSGRADTGGDSTAISDTLVVVDYVENLDRIADVITKIDKRPKQVLVEATILRATLHETDELGIDFNTLGGVDFRSLDSVSPGVTDVTTGLVPNAQLDNASATVRTDFNADISSGGLSVGVITNNIAVFIRAIEAITDVTVMANPKVLALNKQRGEVIVGRRDGYLTTTVTETSAIQTVEFLETGTQLIFRPYIGTDGWIRMEIHPEDSNGGLTSADLPFEETTEATSNIMVRDGQTIVIGGLFRERTTSSKDQVPFFGSIPAVGTLFKSTSDDTNREEVIILLTVHVIKDSAEEQALNEALIEDTERIRASARERLMPIGRGRLAQFHYHWAWTHLAEGNVDQAIADLNMALYHRPRMKSARKLQEELINERLWNDDGTEARTFMLNLLGDSPEAGDKALGRPQPVHDLDVIRERERKAEEYIEREQDEDLLNVGGD